MARDGCRAGAGGGDGALPDVLRHLISCVVAARQSGQHGGYHEGPMPVSRAITHTTRRRWLGAAMCAPWAWAALASDEQRRPWPRGGATPRLALPGLDGA